MTRALFTAAIALMLGAVSAYSQEGASTTRLEAQHKPSTSMGKHLAQYEENLLKTLETGSSAVQAQAVQTFRELEQLFPKYPFSASVAPLSAKLKDEKADPVVRLLAALALDELHSDAGDVVVKEIANSSKDANLQSLCNALLVRSQIK